MMAAVRVDPEICRIQPNATPAIVISSPCRHESAVLGQVEQTEGNGCQHNSGDSAERSHQHRLQEAPKGKFFAQWSQRYGEYGDQQRLNRDPRAVAS